MAFRQNSSTFNGRLSLRTSENCQKGTLLQNAKFDASKAIASKVIHKESNSFVATIDNVFTADQCKELIENCCKEKFDSLIDKYVEKKRNNARRLILDADLAIDLWAFLKPCIDSLLEDNKVSCQPLGFDVLRGEWEVDGLNEAFRINRYSSKSKELFSPHKDSQYCPSGDRRSLLTLLIYTNEDCVGGETNFYFPKVTGSPAKEQLLCKDKTILEEIEGRGGLDEGYLKFSVKPSTGKVVIFSQNILHESCPVVTGTKITIKSDVLSRRFAKSYGFVVSEAEREDYLKCLHHFRRAQSFELCGHRDEAGDLYDRALSIRYCYPSAIQQAEEDFSQTSKSDVYFAFPAVVWHNLFNFLSGVDIEALVRAFPNMWSLRKDWEMRRCLRDRNTYDGNPPYIPRVVLNDGVTTCFSFSDSFFFAENEEGCIRVAAMYAFYLLGHKADDQYYTVRYDPGAQEVTAVALKSLLSDTFLNRPCYGAIYAVNQVDESCQNPEVDFRESVDRTYMSLRHDAHFVGTSLKENMTVKVEWPYIKERDLDALAARMESSGSELEGCTSEEDSDNSEGPESGVREDSDNSEGSESGAKMYKDAILDSIEKTLSSIDDPVDHFVYGYDTDFHEFSSFPVVLKEVIRWNHLPAELTGSDDEAFSWFKRSDVITPGEESTCDNSTAGGLFLQETLNVINESPAVSAALVSKLRNPPLNVDGHMCFCYWPGGNGYAQVDNACDTKCYNHLVFDFSTHQMKVQKEEQPGIELDACADRERFDVEEHCPFYNMPDFGCTEDDLAGLMDVRRYRVDLLPILKQAYPFNHASCNCYVPMFTLTECQNLLDYPMLNHVHVVAGVKKDTSEILLWVIYGGIAAL